MERILLGGGCCKHRQGKELSASMQCIEIRKSRADMARAGLHARVHHGSHRRDSPEMTTPAAHDTACPKNVRAREEVNACHGTSILRRSGGDRGRSQKGLTALPRAATTPGRPPCALGSGSVPPCSTVSLSKHKRRGVPRVRRGTADPPPPTRVRRVDLPKCPSCPTWDGRRALPHGGKKGVRLLTALAVTKKLGLLPSPEVSKMSKRTSGPRARTVSGGDSRRPQTLVDTSKK
jgi:hypothetical protein